MQRDTFQALEIADEQAEIHAMSRGELEARVLEGDRAQATAPPEVAAGCGWPPRPRPTPGSRLRLPKQTTTRCRPTRPGHWLTRWPGEGRLEAANTRYDGWSATTATTRETAGKAKTELQRRGHEQPPQKRRSLRACSNGGRNSGPRRGRRARARPPAPGLDRAGQPWPPVRHPAAQLEAEHAPQPGNSMSGQPEILEPEADPDSERAARLDELRARAADAAARVQAQRAELNTSSRHTARIEREAQAEPEAGWQAEASEEIEMEP